MPGGGTWVARWLHVLRCSTLTHSLGANADCALLGHDSSNGAQPRPTLQTSNLGHLSSARRLCQLLTVTSINHHKSTWTMALPQSMRVTSSPSCSSWASSWSSQISCQHQAWAQAGAQTPKSYSLHF